jgi:hypothetical protein
MLFYNIVWLIIYVTGGISLGILGLADIHYFTLFMVNPAIFDHLLHQAEQRYISYPVAKPIPALVEVQSNY